MENTLDNKAKFFAQYWGQFVIQDVDSAGKEVLYPVERSNMYRFEESILVLKPLSAITNEDAKGMPGFPWESKERMFKYYSFDFCGVSLLLKDLKPIDFDYLRSKGYALPFLGLSVESQISYGWVKLAEVC